MTLTCVGAFAWTHKVMLEEHAWLRTNARISDTSAALHEEDFGLIGNGVFEVTHKGESLA